MDVTRGNDKREERGLDINERTRPSIIRGLPCFRKECLFVCLFCMAVPRKTLCMIFFLFLTGEVCSGKLGLWEMIGSPRTSRKSLRKSNRA